MSTRRDELLIRLAEVGRDNSDATVLFHATVARLLDLNLTDYKTLGLLARVGAMSAGEIARHTGLATASITTLIDRLERKGFVRRIDDPADRRRVIVEAVAERTSAARPYFVSTRQSLNRLYGQYTDKELAVIADFLAKNAQRLRSETERLEHKSRAM
jgi:DNA-binding MarR family transcriptional regulator